MISMWEKQVGKKKILYVKIFNPTGSHDENTYLSFAIKEKAKVLITHLRVESHQLRCETSRWITPEEE